MTASETFRHHASHTKLVDRVAAAPRETTIDAIIVPTARPPGVLDKAMSLGKRLGRPLIVLCSKRSDARSTVTLARELGVEVVAFDVDEDAMTPPLGTAQQVARTVFRRSTDTSRKRNIGLLLARLAGWRQVMFLDDDITVTRELDVNHAAGLLESYDRVGLSNDGYPDNSVVCHAYRDVGGDQDTFVGGGALVVAPEKVTSFFPDIYNEDWFFLLDGEELGKVAVTGTSTQEEYDPYSGPERARSQELGDCLAEGLFSVLDQGGEVHDADHAYWRTFLAARRMLIDEVIAGIPNLATDDHARRQRMESALTAARSRLAMITPAFCVRYVGAWRTDCASWRDHLDRFAEGYLVENQRAALRALLARSHDSRRAEVRALAIWHAAVA